MWSQPRLKMRRQERQKGRVFAPPSLRSTSSEAFFLALLFLISVEYMAFGYMYVDDYQYSTCRLNIRSNLPVVGRGEEVVLDLARDWYYFSCLVSRI